MGLRTDEPVIPPEIEQKIRLLNRSLDNANALYQEIYAWYDAEIKSYCPTASANMEIFDPRYGVSVFQLDQSAMLESLSELQTDNESKEVLSHVMKSQKTPE